MRYADIKPYIEQGLVSEQAHPEAINVHIFNYTPECQFGRKWDDITRQCRGLIMDVETDQILARPFPKFFNYSEHVDNGWPLPSGKPIVREKLDGSLGILYHLNGKPWIATRGSFTSDQALWATKWWRDCMQETVVLPRVTHLFEIIYPENRIVVPYDFSGLVYLASIEIDSGKEVAAGIFNGPIRFAKHHDETDLAKLAALDERTGEGFVVFYPETQERLKIKFPEYVRLHRIVTGLSEKAIWEQLREGKEVDLGDVPDELYKWVAGVEARIKEAMQKLWDAANAIAEDAKKFETRKEAAQFINQYAKHVSGIAFALFDGKYQTAAERAWRMVKPERPERTFGKDIDS